MKHSTQILPKYPEKNIIHQAWGQSPVSVYNQLVRLWANLEIDQKIAIISSKKFGLKKLITFLETYGLSPILVGKDKNGVRIVEIHKNTMKPLEKAGAKNIVEFKVGKKTYTVDTGEAIFSKTRLDAGTCALLDTFLTAKIDLSGKNVADLGCGWGAISVVLAHEYPKAQLTAFELDDAAIDAALHNLVAYSNVEVAKVDLSIRFVDEVESRRGKFDYIVANPPFHVSEIDRNRIFVNASKLLSSSGEMHFVSDSHFAERFKKVAADAFATVVEQKVGDWSIFRCVKG